MTEPVRDERPAELAPLGAQLSCVVVLVVVFVVIGIVGAGSTGADFWGDVALLGALGVALVVGGVALLLVRFWTLAQRTPERSGTAVDVGAAAKPDAPPPRGAGASPYAAPASGPSSDPPRAGLDPAREARGRRLVYAAGGVHALLYAIGTTVGFEASMAVRVVLFVVLLASYAAAFVLAGRHAGGGRLAAGAILLVWYFTPRILFATRVIQHGFPRWLWWSPRWNDLRMFAIAGGLFGIGALWRARVVSRHGRVG